MKAYPVLLVAAALTWTLPSLAEEPAPLAGAQAKLGATGDLAAAARDALARINAMTPEQRAAAAAAAKAQAPALLGEAKQWWSTLSPDQQAAYRAQALGLLSQAKPPKPPKD